MANGTRLVIEVKNGFDPEAILEQLYRQTPMEESFGINDVCLVDGQPRTLGLKELLEVFLGHRYDVVRRRSQFRRDKKAERLHLVDGLLIALLDIDEVIQVIRTSDDRPAARERLMSVFDLSEAQADYILDMQLRRLTRFSRIELEKEQETLRREIEELEAILADEALLRKVVSDELAEVAKTYGTPRRTVLLESAGTTVTAAAAPLEVADDPCFAFLSSSGLLARTVLRRAGRRGRRPRQPRRGRLGGPDHRPRRGRPAHLARPAAQAVRARPARAPGLGQRPQPAGRLPGQRAGLARARRAGAGAEPAGHRRARPGARHPRRHRSSGSTRRCSAKDEWEVIRLDDGDEVVGAVELATGSETLCFITSDAQLLHFGADAVRPQGRSGGGIAGVRLAAGEHVAWFGAVEPDGRRRGDRVRLVDRAARHRAGRGQGDAVRRVPRARAGPPAASAATGSSRARTPWSPPGPATRPPGPRPPAARRSTCPSRSASGTAPARRAASRSPPWPARWEPGWPALRRTTRDAVCEADPVNLRARRASDSARRGPWSSVSRRRAGRVQRRRRRGRRRRGQGQPGGGPGRGEEDARRDQRRRDLADHRGPARRRHRHHLGRGHRRAPVGVRGHLQAQRQRAPGRRRGDRGRRQDLRQELAAAPRLDRRSTPPTTAHPTRRS